MTGPVDPLRAAGHLAAALAARVQDVLPRLRDVEREVADAWPDAAGQTWTERSSLVRRALQRDLDAALAAERAARALLDALVADSAAPERAAPERAAPERDSPERAALDRDSPDRDSPDRTAAGEPGRGTAGAGPGGVGGRGGAARPDRDHGARLGGTDADRTEDGPGMRLGTLDG